MRTALLISLLICGACVRVTPPAPAAPRSAAVVDASFGKTWDAVIDAFADRGIAIETLDRASGLIVPAGYTYPPGNKERDALEYADCGRLGQVPMLPSAVKYNVVVRGDSSRSTVRVRAFYSSLEPNVSCVSRGRWESGAEAVIVARAEGRQPMQTDAASGAPCSQSDRAQTGGGDVAAWVSMPDERGVCGEPVRCVYSGRAAFMSKEEAIAKCRADSYNRNEKRRGKR